MLRCASTLVGFQELPGETSLLVNISGCTVRCEGCHSKALWEDVGEELSPGYLDALLARYDGHVTAMCFMGGDREPDQVDAVAAHVRRRWPGVRVGWYSGASEIGLFTDVGNFDYIKLGPYSPQLGGLRSRLTNQRLYRVEERRLVDITSSFWGPGA